MDLLEELLSKLEATTNPDQEQQIQTQIEEDVYDMSDFLLEQRERNQTPPTKTWWDGNGWIVMAVSAILLFAAAAGVVIYGNFNMQAPPWFARASSRLVPP